jgi:hypothetical protein
MCRGCPAGCFEGAFDPEKNRDEIVLVYKTGTIKRAVQATGTLIPVQG